ncbi:tail fiber assembly protein, partial [Xenorhabdus sp. XENO-10]
MYVYSATDNAFYAIELKPDYINAGSWPADGIEVSDTVYQKFRIPPEGKQRITGSDGLPAWEDIPPPTPEELQRRAGSRKQHLMNEARDRIAPLQDAADLGIATDTEKSVLTAWR